MSYFDNAVWGAANSGLGSVYASGFAPGSIMSMEEYHRAIQAQAGLYVNPAPPKEPAPNLVLLLTGDDE